MTRFIEDQGIHNHNDILILHKKEGSYQSMKAENMQSHRKITKFNPLLLYVKTMLLL